MRANSHLDVALESKRLTPSPYMHWVALVAPWGQGVERNLQIVPWVIETWPPDIPRVSRPPNALSQHLCDIRKAHYEFSTVVTSRC